uniref:Potassium channel tetramerization domain containing 6a n=1 Tax=Gasterosteus aculeatus aculeatus TaxID=481459 RepID=G3NIR2_GASAC
SEETSPRPGTLTETTSSTATARCSEAHSGPGGSSQPKTYLQPGLPVQCASYILNFLRTAELTLPCDFKEAKLLRKEADFYQIEPLIQCLGDPKPLLPYPTDSYEEVVELSSTRKLSKYSNPVAVIITQLTITTKVPAVLESISSSFTKWNKHMMDTRDLQGSFTFGPCDHQQEVSLRVHLLDFISKAGFTIRNTRVHHMSERANENTVEHHWTFCRRTHRADE